MRKIYTLFFAASFSLPLALNAQNWDLLNAADHHHFRLDGDATITATIRTTSAQLQGLDSVFQLNRISCDSCLTWASGPMGACDTCYGLRNLPQFLQRTATKLPNGDYTFTGPGNILVKPQASLAQSWTFDAANSITAIVTAAYSGTVLGNTDSIKVAMLSSGDSVSWSKDHGLLKYPAAYGSGNYYRLVGIQTRQLGQLVPLMRDFYDIQAGDIFEYEAYQTNGMSPVWQDMQRKDYVLARQDMGDSIVLTVHSLLMTYDYNLFPQPGGSYVWNYWSYTQNYYYEASELAGLDAYNNEWVIDGTNNAPFYRAQRFLEPLEGRESLKYGRQDRPASQDGLWANGPTWTAPVPSASDTLMHYDMNYYYQNPGTPVHTYLGAIYSAGLGRTYYWMSTFFESSFVEQLVAYKKGNDTVGVFTPDDVLTGLPPSASKETFKLFPNPASDIFFLEGEIAGAQLTLLDMQGRQVLKQMAQTNSPRVDVSSLPAGIYLLQVLTEKGEVSQKKIAVRR